ncbi:IS66-like element accessory protein TnpA [Mesorhizobium japonicum]|uniref:Mlr8759 protein n=1 Tax=Mesorhizobium japonicum (strain LMG 29417 / CECT 9101 / MAFF 303099) TaxID=266835 RepID=Q989X7_RHILO|nr:transposase [Mesorhizobium japonicum]BAB52567.1 mlr8759 [Mesorhizobium japonicum MAFF 303099]
MADGEGFVGRCEVVEPRRGNRRWPNDLKARIVAESLQRGARVVDVARRHDLIAHQLSDWRRQARQGLLALPAELMPVPCENSGPFEPAFVPLAITTEPKEAADALPVPEPVEITLGIMTVEIGADLVVRVPGDEPVDRVAALVRAMRGTA